MFITFSDISHNVWWVSAHTKSTCKYVFHKMFNRNLEFFFTSWNITDCLAKSKSKNTSLFEHPCHLITDAVLSKFSFKCVLLRVHDTSKTYWNFSGQCFGSVFTTRFKTQFSLYISSWQPNPSLGHTEIFHRIILIHHFWKTIHFNPLLPWNNTTTSTTR